MNNRAVFLDRDGTLNEDPGYLGDPGRLVLYPDAAYSLSILKNRYNFRLIVISNQSGIARGLISETEVIAVNNELDRQLRESEVFIDDFYYCPSHPDYSSIEECGCRKPSPKMIFDASAKHKIDLTMSYLIGDSETDIMAGKNAGVKTVLVKTGHGAETISILQKDNNFPSFVAENLTEACSYIIKDSFGETFSV